jgi:hypothetical protein
MSVKGIWDRAPLKLAGALLFTAGAGILMGIITAEALYPAAYSTFENTISDLGATRPPDSVVLQPSAAIFDITMLVTGAMIVVAAWLVHRSPGGDDLAGLLRDRRLRRRGLASDDDRQTGDDQRVSTFLRRARATTMGKTWSPARPWTTSGTGSDQDVSLSRRDRAATTRVCRNRVGAPVQHGQDRLLATLAAATSSQERTSLLAEKGGSSQRRRACEPISQARASSTLDPYRARREKKLGGSMTCSGIHAPGSSISPSNNEPTRAAAPAAVASACTRPASVA